MWYLLYILYVYKYVKVFLNLEVVNKSVDWKGMYVCYDSLNEELKKILKFFLKMEILIW